MNRLLKAILVVLGAVAALVAVGSLMLNLYLQSDNARASLEAGLSRALDLPIQIKGTSFTPFSGVKLNGVTVLNDERGPDGAFLESSSVTVSFKMLPLLSRRFIMDEVSLNDPRVVWAQTDGKYRLPERPKAAPTPEPAPPVIVEATPPPVEPQPPGTATPRAPKASAKSSPSFAVEVRKFRIRHGSFDFKGEDGASFARFDEIDATADVSNGVHVEGSASAQKTLLANRFVVTDFRAPFTYSAETLRLQKMSGRLADGTLNGDFEIAPEEKNAPFAARLEFDEVDMHQILQQAGISVLKATGSMKGFIDVTGEAKRAERMNGRGAIVIRNGQIEQYPVLQMIGRALQIDELERMTLTEAEARYTLEKGNVLVEKLTLKSQNLQLDAVGKIKRKGSLDLDARLSLGPAISRQLPGFVEKNFTSLEGTDQRYVDFKITGTVDRPETNLIEIVVGRQLKNEAMDFIQRLWK